MISLKFSLCLFALQLSIVRAIDFQEVKNEKGTVEFVVNAGNELKLPNQHRLQAPQLKLSLNGEVSISKVDPKSATQWTLTLNDSILVDFTAEEKNQSVTEYYLLWHGGGSNEKREVCFHYGTGNWFAAYKSAEQSWPMDTNKTTILQQFNYLFGFERYTTSNDDREFNLLLEQLFLSSDGFAILLDPQAPWFMRRDPNGHDPLLCFSVDNDLPYLEYNREMQYLDIKIHLFAASNIRTVIDYVVHESGLIPKPTKVANEDYFWYPTWTRYEMDSCEQEVIEEYAVNITTKYGVSNKNQLLIDCFWQQTYYGNYSFSSREFPNTTAMFDHLHSLNFTVGVNVDDPYVTPDAEHGNEFFMFDQDKKSHAHLIDFSNPKAVQWFSDQLAGLLKEHPGIDRFSMGFFVWEVEKLVHLTVQDGEFGKYPSKLATKYVETVEASTKPGKLVTEVGFKTQHLPDFFRLTQDIYTHDHELLSGLIPNMLAASIAGYPFIMPYSIGGFNYGHDRWSSNETYIRLLEATALMPAMIFSKPPWVYEDATVLELTKKYLALHAEHVPLMLELAKKRIQDGSPIIRPLWYSAPDDAKAQKVGNQFMLGEDIIVAPVLVELERKRTVYLPVGNWADQHGKVYTGPGEFTVEAPLDELPVFNRKQ